MPVVLLVLGVVTTLAGLVLAASGLTTRDGAFDTEILTPGAVAVVGGLLLVGLGLVVRELRRIERTLAARPMPKAAGVEAIAAIRESDTPIAIPPPMPATEPAVPPLTAPVAEGLVEDTGLEHLRAKFPIMARAENNRLADAADVPQALREAAGLSDLAEVRNVAAVGGPTSGAATTARAAPRTAAKARQTASSGKARISVFNTFWPMTPRREGRASAQVAASAQIAAQVAAPAAPIADNSVLPAEELQPLPLPELGAVSVLKSGVVEGMAYTLYSDGSIEALLPQGMLRFGSIGALRDHIENTA